MAIAKSVEWSILTPKSLLQFSFVQAYLDFSTCYFYDIKEGTETFWSFSYHFRCSKLVRRRLIHTNISIERFDITSLRLLLSNPYNPHEKFDFSFWTYPIIIFLDQSKWGLFKAAEKLVENGRLQIFKMIFNFS